MIAQFVFKCFLIYLAILLAALTLNFKPVYTNFIIRNGNTFLNKVNNKATIQYRLSNKKGKPPVKAKIKLVNTDYQKNFYMDVWRVGFLPFAFIIALFGATKFQTVRRKIIYSILGVLVVHLFTLLFFKLKSIYFYHLFLKEVEKTEMLRFAGPIEFIDKVFLNNIVFVLAIPVLVWFALTYKSNYFFTKLFVKNITNPLS